MKRTLLACASLALALCGCDLGKLTCDAPKIACSDTCIDITADSSNCGACGNTCAAGEICKASACAPGPKTTVYATCFNGGQLFSFDGDLKPIDSGTIVGGGPQSMAWGEGRLLVADTMDKALYSFDPATTPPTRRGGDKLGQAVNQVLVHGSRAYALNSVDNSVQVVDLTKELPGSLDTSRTVDQIVTGDNTNPYFGAFVGDRLYVTLLGACTDAGETAGNRLQEIDFSQTPGQLGRVLVFDPASFEKFEGQTNSPRPAGIAARGNLLYVAIGNRGPQCWGDAGPGYLAVVDTVGADLKMARAIKLPDTCRNPGTVLATDIRIYVGCLGAYGSGAEREESLVVLDAATETVLHSTFFPRCDSYEDGPNACRSVVPGHLTLSGDRLLIADMNAGRILVTDLEGNVLSGLENGAAVCPLKCRDGETGCYQMITDVIAVTR